jgi:hypothetical protein
MNSNNLEFTPLEAEEPREQRLGGIKGGSRKTRFYREQLTANPGKWFVWKKNGKYASETGGALRTLTGLSNLSGVDRSILPYEATAQKQDDGSYTTYVRSRSEASEVTPLSERISNAVTNPFSN